LTLRVRSPRVVPLSALIAASASAAAISTKLNPRERPLSRSVTTLTDSTVPWSVKAGAVGHRLR
jgi:hypothetical protein